MDFLDPKTKRRHKIQLFIGYGLMATVILVTSAILVFSAYGFDVDRKTGEVIQNGLVFVDSSPDKATVKFNDQPQKAKSNDRYALPSGEYDLKIQKDGYRDWQRNFSLNGGEVERFTYPLLLPTKLERREVQTYAAAPTFVTQSPDRQWAIVSIGGSLTDFTEYNLNNLIQPDDTPQARQFSVSTSLFTPAEGAHALELVEWSSDNKHFLIKHTFAMGSEFVVISRDAPLTSININRLLGLNPTQLTLRDKKFDQWYLFTQESGVLQSANANKVVAPIATGVTSYKGYDSNIVLYASPAGTDAAKQRITIKQGSNSYVIREVATGTIVLDVARYDNALYVVIGSEADKKTYIYKDPVSVLQKNEDNVPAPQNILKSVGDLTTNISFSKNNRFIAAQSGQHLETFDAEYDQTFRYDIPNSFDAGTPVTWLDGHHVTARSAGKALIFDFDGSNLQELVAAQAGTPLLLDRDNKKLYNIDVSTKPETFGLFSSDLRLSGDK